MSETLTILLIEGDPDYVRITRRLLARENGVPFHLEVTNSLSAGLARLEAGGVDAVLLDLSLPDSLTADTFSRVHHQAPQIPIIMLTGADDEALARETVRQGAQDYLVKGQIKSSLLSRSICYAVERNRARQEREQLLMQVQQERQRAGELAAQLQTVFDAMTDSVAVYDARGFPVRASAALIAALGFDPAGQDRVALAKQLSIRHPDGRLVAADELPSSRALRGQTVRNEQLTFTNAQGREQVILASASPLFADGGLAGVVAVYHDVTRQARTEAHVHHLNEVLLAVRDVNQLIACERDPQRLLADACTILLRARSYCLVWIGQTEAGSHRVRPVARAGQGANYLDNITITYDEGETAQGPTGTVLRTRQPAVCQDMLTDSRFAPWRDAALTRGYASSAAVPMICGERLFGVLSVYADQPGAFGDEETNLLQELGNDLALALQSIEDETERRRAEEALRESEARFRQIFDNMSSGVAVYEAIKGGQDFVFKDFNQAAEKIERIAKHDLIGKSVLEVFSGVKEFGLFEVFERVWRTGQPEHHPIGLYKDDRVAGWKENYVYKLPSGEIVAIYDDVTRRKQAEEALRNKVMALQTLAEIDREVIGATEPQGILELVCRRAAELVYAPKSAIAIRTVSAEIEMAASYGLSDAERVRASQELARAWQADSLRPGRWMAREATGVNDIPADAGHVPGLAQEDIRSITTVQLAAGEAILGALTVFDTMPREWTTDEMEILNMLASQAAVALEKVRLYQAARSRALHLATLNDISRAITSTLDLDDVLTTLLEQVRQATHAEACSVALVDKETGELMMRQAAGVAQHAMIGLRLKPGQGIAGWVALHRQPALVPDAASDPRFYAEMDLLTGFTTHDLVCAPLIARDTVAGVLELINKQNGRFDEDDVRLLESVAAQATIAIENARLFETEHAARQRLETLYRIGQTINSTLDANAILDRLTDEAIRATHATHGSALVARPDLGYFERRSLRGYSPELVERAHTLLLPLDRGVNGRAYKLQQVIYLPDVRTDPDYFALIPNTRSELAVPIIRGGQAIGNLDLQSPQVDAFRDVDMDFLQALMDQVAIALENARLFGETRRWLDELSIVSNVALIGAAGRPFDETVARATKDLCRLWPDASVGFLFIDEADQSLCMHPSYHGVPEELITSLRIPVGQGIIGWAVRERQPIRVGDVTSDPRYITKAPNTRSEIAAPLAVGEHVIGVVNVESPWRDAFSEEDLRLLATLAGQLATLFEKTRLDAVLEQERTSLARRVAERTVELSTANAELAKVARLKDEFLASMSHELRTPLNAILGLSESLQEQVYGPLTEKQFEALRTIEESGRHLLALISDILDLSKIEADKLELQIDAVSVDSVCQSSLQFVKQTAQEKRITLDSTLDDQVQTIQCDQRRIKQILVNLLSNAVKFTPVGGTVGLDVVGDMERQAVHFTVWDTGIGIATEDMGRLFKPFVQLDSSLARQYAGTGLGLSLVQRLTEAHGGSVSVESEVGRGSRFTVSLPWQPTPASAEPVPETHPAAKAKSDSHGELRPWPHAEGELVLLVEDNESNLAFLSDYVSSQGYRVLTARNGHEAIELAKVERPAVILMDSQMPGMDGLEATRRIRAIADLARVRIIALTALVMPGDRERCLAAGANEYMSKPVGLKQLAAAIEAQLSGRD